MLSPARLRIVDPPDEKKKVFERFSKAIADLEARRKSKIFCIIHTAPPAHICGPDICQLLVNRRQFDGLGSGDCGLRVERAGTVGSRMIGGFGHRTEAALAAEPFVAWTFLVPRKPAVA